MLIKLLKNFRVFRFPWEIYRYILSEISRPFLGATVFFAFVLMMFQVIRLADFFVVHNVSGYSILLLMYYLLLTFTPVIFPIAFLLAVLMGFGRLSADSEVLAMRASGVSVKSMLVPVMGLGVLLSLVTLVCNMYFVPFGTKMFRYDLFRITNTKAIATIHEGTFTEGFFDLVLYADVVDPKKNALERVLIYDERKEGQPVTIVARHGRILNNLQDESGVPGLVLRLYTGSLHRGDPSRDIYEKTDFEVYDIFLRIETAKVVGVENPKTMEMGALKARVDQVKGYMHDLNLPFEKLSRNEQLDYINFGAEYWKRIALAASCLVFALMGVAFGVVRTRTVRSNSFIICLGVLLIYWAVYSYGFSLASDGKVPAFVGTFAANVLMLAVSLYTFRRVAR
ncbi:MAG TPA: LPS export ABC transporter permease LptF [Bdellovibrionota bacterium]|jgi:lipopolysaccharide export system permease protein